MCKYCEGKAIRKNQKITVEITRNMINKDKYYLKISTKGTAEVVDIRFCPMCREKFSRKGVNELLLYSKSNTSHMFY